MQYAIYEAAGKLLTRGSRHRTVAAELTRFEFTHVNVVVGPRERPATVHLVVFKLTLIAIQRATVGQHKHATTLAFVLKKIACVGTSVRPRVLTFAMKLIGFKGAFVAIAICPGINPFAGA